MSTENGNRYQKSWDGFWGTLTGEISEVLWNVPHQDAVASDFKLFQDLIVDNALPLVDIGCGDGTQTEFFGQHVQQVIGIDVSAQAIEIAKSNSQSTTITYQVLDLLDTPACTAFHQKIGDANLYMRGVLMQFSDADRLTVVDNLKRLMGDAGYLFMNEYLPQTKAYYQSIFESQGMPDGFKRVLQHGITPGGISEDDLETFFPPAEYTRIRQGDYFMGTNIALADGGVVKAPSFYLVLKKQ